MLLSPNIIISQQSLDSDDHYDVIYANLDFLNGLFSVYVDYAEIAPEAVHSYFVDYYATQMNNGGFAEFVYHSDWNASKIESVREGLSALQASQHLQHFIKMSALVDEMSQADLKLLLDEDYFGDNQQRDHLNQLNHDYFAIDQVEDLMEINYQWLVNHPNTVVLDEDLLWGKIEKISNQVTDRDLRKQRFLATQPRLIQIVHALCQSVGQEFERPTITSPTDYEGKRVVEYHFISDAGHFYLIDLGYEAKMFDKKKQQISAIDVSHIVAE